MPNLPDDVNSWGRSACYPQGNFYPLSDGNSTLFTTGSLSPTFVSARLVSLAVNPPSAFTLFLAISNRIEVNFERLRYSFGGDRPSQTAHLTLSYTQLMGTS